MRVHLVAPFKDRTPGARANVFPAPPLTLATVAGLTPPEVEVSITDEQVEPIDWDRPADLVGITATTQTVTRAYQVADAFRARGVKVVVGGIHPSALPEEALQHADSVVVGEAEGAWPQLLCDFQNGGVQPLYHSNGFPSLAGLPRPRRDLLRRKHYLIRDSIWTTRGCPFGCSFCSVTSFFGGTYRWRPVDEVAKEIEGLGGRRLILFVDDNVIGHRGYSRELFRAMMPHKLNWIGQASVTIAKDETLLAEAADSGCLGLLLGIESVSPASLRSMGKRHNVVEEYEESIRRIQSHGINVVGSFIFGFDHDTEDVFEETVRFAQRTRLEGALFSILTPYPGTALFNSLDREGRLLTKDWSRYREDHAVFEPKLMSPQRLVEGRRWALCEFYSLSSVWSRVGLAHRWLPLVWAMNLAFREDGTSRVLFDRLSGLVSSFF